MKVKFTLDYLKKIKDNDLIHWTYQTDTIMEQYANSVNRSVVPLNNQLMEFIDRINDTYRVKLRFIRYGEDFEGHRNPKNWQIDSPNICNSDCVVLRTHDDSSIDYAYDDEGNSLEYYETKTREEVRNNLQPFSHDFRIPSHIYRIYSKGSFVHDDPKIVCVPNGICNRIIESVLSDRNKIYEGIKRHHKLFYCNVGLHIGAHEPRNEWCDIIKNQKDALSWQSWPNYDEFQEGDYFRGMYEHKFTFSPEGNASDSHRTWEALYAGSIPVVIKNSNMEHFKDLPILMVDDWSVVTKEFLEKKYEEMMSKKWNLDKLKLSYWLKKIEKDIEKLSLPEPITELLSNKENV